MIQQLQSVNQVQPLYAGVSANLSPARPAGPILPAASHYCWLFPCLFQTLSHSEQKNQNHQI